MARKFQLFPNRDLKNRIKDLESKVRSYDNYDLKGGTLLDLINSNSGGSNATPKQAMKFTAVLAAVSLRSELLASFPKQILKTTSNGREPDNKHPLYRLLAYQPNQFMNAFTFWELVNTHLDLWGNAYVFITKYAKEVVDLTPVAPGNVEVLVEGGKVIYRVQDTGVKAIDRDHSPSQFLHFKDISYDGLVGQSRIKLASTAIDLGLSAEDFAKEFFDKGGHSKGIIEMDASLGDDAYAAFKKRWDDNANYGTPILDNGKKYHQLTIPMEDAQLIASREFQVDDIARVFRVPSTLINSYGRATWSNASEMDLSFMKYSLRPMVKRFEMELESKLLGSELGDINIRFNMDGILRADTASRATYYSTMKTSKIMTTNEIRALENMNPIEGGDILENPATSTDKTNEENN